MTRHRPVVYIMASTFQHLYIGITNNIARRVHEHRSATTPASFTARYRIDKLVYYEQFVTFPTAIAREKQLKGWLRSRKIQLVVTDNPTWRDLSLDWYTPIQDQSTSFHPVHSPTQPPPSS